MDVGRVGACAGLAHTAHTLNDSFINPHEIHRQSRRGGREDGTRAHLAICEYQIPQAEGVTQSVPFNLHGVVAIRHRILQGPVLETLIL